MVRGRAAMAGKALQIDANRWKSAALVESGDDADGENGKMGVLHVLFPPFALPAASCQLPQLQLFLPCQLAAQPTR